MLPGLGKKNTVVLKKADSLVKARYFLRKLCLNPLELSETIISCTWSFCSVKVLNFAPESVWIAAVVPRGAR